jgi:hypothetical protein
VINEEEGEIVSRRLQIGDKLKVSSGKSALLETESWLFACTCTVVAGLSSCLMSLPPKDWTTPLEAALSAG